MLNIGKTMTPVLLSRIIVNPVFKADSFISSKENPLLVLYKIVRMSKRPGLDIFQV